MILAHIIKHINRTPLQEHIIITRSLVSLILIGPQLKQAIVLRFIILPFYVFIYYLICNMQYAIIDILAFFYEAVPLCS